MKESIYCCSGLIALKSKLLHGSGIRIWIGIGLVLLASLLFAPAATFDFLHLYDDQLYVTQNPRVLTGLSMENIGWAFQTFYAANWHPLTWISLMADGQIFGTGPAGYHISNIAFYAANCVVLFLVLCRLTGAVWRSAFVASLFAAHPLHVESVAWITERKDVLSTLLFLAAISLYASYARRPSRARYLFVVSSFVLALLAKPMVVTLPFVLLLLDFWPLGRTGTMPARALLLEKVPLVVLSAVSCFVTFLAQQEGGSVAPLTALPLGSRVANALVSYARYLGATFWPHDLIVPYVFESHIAVSYLCWTAFLLLGVTVVAVLTRRQRPYLLLGWLWFLGTLVPVIGLVQVGMQSRADRYMYIPSIGVFVAVTWLAADLFRTWRIPRRVVAPTGVSVIAILSWLTASQLKHWRNVESLFSHTLAVRPNDVSALRILSFNYLTHHELDKAMSGLQILLRETPGDGAVHYHMGEIYDSRGQESRAAEEYRLATELPSSEGSHNEILAAALNNLAWLRATSADPSLRDGNAAVRLAEQCCELTANPSAAQLGTLAAAFAERGDYPEAVATAARAREMARQSHEDALANETEQRLNLYRHQQPYRQPEK